MVLKKKKNAVLFSQYKEYKKLFEILQDKSKSIKKTMKGEQGEPDASHSSSKTPAGPVTISGPIEENISEKKASLEIQKLDYTTNKLKRQNAILKNLETLYDREMRRYRNLKKEFDRELLRQSPLEREVKEVMRKFLQAAFNKRVKKHDTTNLDDIDMIKIDPEFYRLGLTRDERMTLVELMLKNPRISDALDDKLKIDPDVQLNLEDSDFDDLGDDFFS